jgi:hypothetical protein
VELDARGRRLRAALAAVLLPDNAPEPRLVHDWLDNSRSDTVLGSVPFEVLR